MAKWKNTALITTLVLPLAVTAGGQGVAMASQAKPDQTTIKIHKQIRYDDTISGLVDDEKYFTWNHGADEDGQHYFWGDGTEANKDTVTQDGDVVSSNNPFDWHNYSKTTGKYTIDYTPSGDFEGQKTVRWNDLWTDLPGVHFIGIQLPDDVMTVKDGVPTIIAKDAADNAGVAFTFNGEKIYWQDILLSQKGVQHSDAADPSHETPKHNFNSKNGTDKYGMEHTVNTSASEYEVEFQRVGNAADLTEAQIRQQLVANYTDTDEDSPVFGGMSGAQTDENGVLSFENVTNGNWLFMEDLQESTPELAKMVTQHAAPMFLATPYLQPSAEVDSKGNGTNKGDKTWFDNTDANAMHIYAKNYAAHADLTIEKLDDDTSAPLAGVQFAMVELTAEQLAALQGQIQGGLLNGSVDSIKAYLATLGTENETLFYGTTGKDGKAKFSNLIPGKTYYALEISTPTDYMVNPTVQQVSINGVDDTAVDPTVGGEDTTVQAQGGFYVVRNDDQISLDKDISVLGPVEVTDLAVNGYDANGNPIYVDKSTAQTSATGETTYANTYQDNDTLYGTSRGQAFSYTVDMELNKNIASYSKFNLQDSIPFQVNINSWMMYAQVNGTLTPLIQAVDPDGDASEHSTDDGISNVSLPYDSATEVGGVNFKFYNDAAAKVFGYDGSTGKTPAEIAAQTAWIAENLLHMYGASSEYTFDTDFHELLEGQNGTMNIDFKSAMLQGLGDFIADDKTGKTSLVFKMNAQTNSAAQANAKIDNKATLNFNPYAATPTRAYGDQSLSDSAATSAVGWDIVKTDEKGNRLSGAGFDLGLRVTRDNIDRVKDQLLSMNNNGNAVNETSLLDLAEKMKYTGDKASKLAQATAYLNSQATQLEARVNSGMETYVWFVHLDAPTTTEGHGTLQPIFGTMESNMQMGDIYWVLDQDLSTTHITKDDGYLQYCGVADGQYILSESIVPGGYNKEADAKFTLASDEGSYYVSGAGANLTEFPLLTNQKGEAMYTDDKIEGADSTNYHQVENQKKTESIFPITGGIGILGALAAGLTAMGSAIVNHRRQ